MTRGHVLVVDDDMDFCDFLQAGLEQQGFAPVTAPAAERAFERLEEEEFDAIVADLNLRGGMSGTDLCGRVSERWPWLPVIVMTAFGSLDSAVAAIRAGAYDFIQKPLEIETLGVALSRAVRHRALELEVRQLRREVEEARGFGALLGKSPAMGRVYSLLDRVADSAASVLIVGESGSGKELAARALHSRGPQRDGPFVAINCAAMPEALLESELFGHVRGAFTDARSAKTGLLQQANGGTLLLDEIGDMPLALQPKLLRALEERAARPVGGNAPVPFEARVIAATNQDLEELVEERRFREDLYYRINVIQVELPPLRARGNDVLLLAQRFLEEFAERSGRAVVGLAPSAAEKLQLYNWPGNVRELRNCMERAVALTRYSEITVDDLPERVRAHVPERPIIASDDPAELVSLSELERRYVLRVYEAAGRNQSLAARILGVDRKTLYRRLERYHASNRSS